MGTEPLKIKMVVTRGSLLWAALREIPGWKYHRNIHVWEFPAIVLYDLAKAVKELHPKLHKHLLTNPVFEKQRLAADEAIEQTKDSRLTHADLDIPAPVGEAYKGYQKALVQYAITRKCKGVLCADDMGVGKTIETLAFINYQNHLTDGKFQNVLIVCPSSVKYNWEEEADKWIVDRSIPITVLSTKKADLKFKPKGIVIINYDILEAWSVLLSCNWDLFVADECTYLKNAKAKRTKAGLVLANMATWKFFLSGTPIEKQPSEVWNALHTIDPETWGDEMKFLKRYCGPSTNWFTGQLEFKGATNMDEFGVKARTSCMIRRLKSDVADELPPKIIQTIAFLPSTKAKALIDKELAMYQKRKTLGRDLGTSGASRGEVDEDGDSWAVLRQRTALEKLPAALNFIEELLLQEDKVVVFAHHKIIQEKIAQHFKGRCCLGRMAGSSEQRQEQVNKFKSPNFKGVFVASLEGDKMGINLQVAKVACFVEQSGIPSTMDQAEDRVHRQGQKGQVIIYYLTLKGSLDYDIAKTRQDRSRSIKLGTR